MPSYVMGSCPCRPAGSCVIDFGEYSSLSSPTYINQHNTCETHIGITGNCTWYAADRVQQLTGVDLAVYQSAWGDGGQWHVTASNHGFPVYQGSSEAINAFGTLAGLVISFNGIKLGFTTHVAVVEKYNDDGTAWVSEMWGSESSSFNIRITSYSASELASSNMYYIDFSSIGMAPGAGGGYFKDKFGEFHWKEAPIKDGLIPLKDEFQSFCDRLNEAQQEAKVENIDTYSATDNNSTLTAERFNNMLHLMQTSTEGILKGVNEDEVAHMSDVNKNDLIKAEHFQQLEDLYNHWRYGTSQSGTDVPMEGSYAERVWDYLRSLGLNENATAGILGNMMAECGGQTLNLDPFIIGYTPNFSYGLCQWTADFGINGYNGKDIWYASFEDQLRFLNNTLSLTMAFWCGSSAYENFKNSTSPQQAAYNFQWCYERGYGDAQRQRNALIAYNTFKGRPLWTPEQGGTASGNFILPLQGWYGSANCRTGDTNNAGDYPAPYNTPVIAADGGTVEQSQIWDGYTQCFPSNSLQTYGNSVLINHGNGWKTRYAHFSGAPLVSYGQTVSQGQLLGYVGSTGCSSGAHLHFEMIYNGVGYCPNDII